MGTLTKLLLINHPMSWTGGDSYKVLTIPPLQVEGPHGSWL